MVGAYRPGPSAWPVLVAPGLGIETSGRAPAIGRTSGWSGARHGRRILRTRMGLTRPVRLLISSLAEGPSVVGWIRPVILLPAATLLGLTPEQLEAVLAHEFAHIRRYDYLVNILQMVVETLLFYHPAVWWTSARIRHERELCCDDLAVSSCGDPLCYARALTKLERLRDARAEHGHGQHRWSADVPDSETHRSRHSTLRAIQAARCSGDLSRRGLHCALPELDSPSRSGRAVQAPESGCTGAASSGCARRTRGSRRRRGCLIASRWNIRAPRSMTTSKAGCK